MARTPDRRSPTSKTVAKLRRDLDHCSEKVDQLEREIAINVKRMGAMQAELDHVRSLFRGV